MRAVVAVAALAIGYFAIGIRWTFGLPLGWIDSGLVVYGSWRVAHGGLPYVDFDHVYGASLFFLNAALLRLFGDDLAVVTSSLVVLKAGIAALVWALARRVATTGVAVLVVAILVVVWGAPLWLFASPYAQHYATACALAGLLAIARPRASRPRGRVAVAGLLAGLAATFKTTSGVVALIAFVHAALADHTIRDDRGRPPAGGIVLVRRAAALTTLVAGVLYALGSVPGSAGPAALATVTIVAAPFVWFAMGIVHDEVAARPVRTADVAGARDVVLLVATAGIPPLAWLLFYATRGGAAALLRDVLVLPTRLQWFEPLRVPSALAALVVVAVVAAAAAARAARPRTPGAIAVVATAAAIVAAVIAPPAATPWAVLGTLAYDVLAALPPLVVVLAVGARSATADVPHAYAARADLAFAAAHLLLLLPAADVWHAFMVLPAVLPLLASELAPGPRARDALHRTLAAAPLVGLVAVAVPFVAQLRTAERAWRSASARFARATAITHPDPRFTDVAALVTELETPALRDRRVVVLTAEAMIYFLAGRRSACEHEEYLLQTLVRGAASPGSCALLADDAAFARRLAATRPLVVDDVSHPALAGLRRYYPRVSRLLARRYRVSRTLGRYVILDLSPAARSTARPPAP